MGSTRTVKNRPLFPPVISRPVVLDVDDGEDFLGDFVLDSVDSPLRNQRRVKMSFGQEVSGLVIKDFSLLKYFQNRTKGF